MPSECNSAARVHGHIVKVVGDDRFRGAAEANLIGHDYAKSCVAQSLDGPTKVEAPEIHSVEQNYCSAVWVGCGLNVHIRHAYILAVEGQRQIHYRIGVGDILIGDAAGLYIGGRLHRGVRLSLDGRGLSMQRGGLSKREYDEEP